MHGHSEHPSSATRGRLFFDCSTLALRRMESPALSCAPANTQPFQFFALALSGSGLGVQAWRLVCLGFWRASSSAEERKSYHPHRISPTLIRNLRLASPPLRQAVRAVSSIVLEYQKLRQFAPPHVKLQGSCCYFLGS